MSVLENNIEKVMAHGHGKGIQYLLNVGYKILGNPIYILDIDYKLLAYTGNLMKDDLLWKELMETGIHGEETIELFKNEYFFDAIANTEIVTFLISKKLKYDRIIGKIRNRDNITVAFAYVVASEKTFEDDDLNIFKALCKKISEDISKSKFYETYGEMHQEAVINKLIDGRIEDKRLYTSCIAEIYEGLKNYLYVAIADIKEIDSKRAIPAYFKNILKQKQPMFKYTIYANYIIIIISSDEAAFNVKKDLKDLEALIERHHIYVGISSCFENLFELQKYYIEALDALNDGLKSSGCGRIYLHDEEAKIEY